MEGIFKLLLSPYAGFGYAGMIMASIIVVAFKAGALLEKYKVVEKVLENIDKIKDSLAMIKADIVILKESNLKKSPYAQSQSPLVLSKEGARVSEMLGAKGMVVGHWEKNFKKCNIDQKDIDKYDPEQTNDLDT